MHAIQTVLPDLQPPAGDAADPFHITLGQCANMKGASELERGLEDEEWAWSVGSVVLLRQTGKRFAILAEFPLMEGEARCNGSGAADARRGGNAPSASGLD